MLKTLWKIVENLDFVIFEFFNIGIANPAFDTFFTFITNVENWLITFVILFIWLIWKGGKRGRIAALALATTIIISDMAITTTLKESIGRERPCRQHPQETRLLVGCGIGKSMPSAHAVNMFAAFAVMSFFYRKYRWPYGIIAGLVAFSRIYVGVHYPSDVIAGAALGLIIGKAFTYASQKIPILKITQESDSESPARQKIIPKKQD